MRWIKATEVVWVTAAGYASVDCEGGVLVRSRGVQCTTRQNRDHGVKKYVSVLSVVGGRGGGACAGRS